VSSTAGALQSVGAPSPLLVLVAAAFLVDPSIQGTLLTPGASLVRGNGSIAHAASSPASLDRGTPLRAIECPSNE
jgi:hypothetical protein